MLADKLTPFINRYNELSDLLSSPDITSDIKKMTELSKEQSSLLPIVEKAKEYKIIVQEIADSKEMLADPEMAEMAKEELKELEPQIPLLEEEIKMLMLPKDPNDDRNIIMELRAGTGGDEAALFVGDMFNAYTRYAELRDWKIEI
ncbi:MAG: PCRF domain-containing protein, partial [Sulfurimonas sp.]